MEPLGRWMEILGHYTCTLSSPYCDDIWVETFFLTLNTPRRNGYILGIMSRWKGRKPNGQPND